MENKRENILKNFEENFILKILICVVLCSIIISIFFVFNRVIDKKKFHKYTVTENINLINSIENICIENSKLMINGYAFMLNRDSKENSISIFIRNINTNKEIWFDIVQTDRSDVNIYFGGEFDYTNSGFKASTNIDRLKQNETYEIFVNIDYKEPSVKGLSRTTVSTRKYVLNNRLYSYNPNDLTHMELNTDSKLLRDIFNDGYQCLHQKENGIYVYQYKDKLYWIATKDFDFDDEGATYIPYQLYTTEVDKLPENRIEHKFDNLDFIFEQYEYKDENTVPYRVAIRDIPKDYAITHIKTGVYDRVSKKWIWTKNFQLDNVIDER